jgi:hypothetical protein
MKRHIIIAALALWSISVQAQQYVCKNGMTHFFSATAVENIEATSKTSICALNTATKKVIAKISNTSFTFKDKLMQEHFNENYMESNKYTTSSLDGTIQEEIDWTKDGDYDVTINGTFDMHGVKLCRLFKGKLTVKNGAPLRAVAKFDVKLADHKIKIPSIVGANIAELIAVDLDYTFEKYEKKK